MARRHPSGGEAGHPRLSAPGNGVRRVRAPISSSLTPETAACLIAAGGYLFLAHRGVLRWLASGLVIVVLIAVLLDLLSGHRGA